GPLYLRHQLLRGVAAGARMGGARAHNRRAPDTAKPRPLPLQRLLARSGTDRGSAQRKRYPQLDRTLTMCAALLRRCHRLRMGPRSEERRVGKECRYRWSARSTKIKKQQKQVKIK